MTYSCGVFPPKSCSLDRASLNKYERICRKLALRPHDHVVEIGGWVGFALYAAQNYGCRVTTTISRQQYEHARRMAQQAGLEKRVRILRQDYRKHALVWAVITPLLLALHQGIDQLFQPGDLNQ